MKEKIDINEFIITLLKSVNGKIEHVKLKSKTFVNFIGIDLKLIMRAIKIKDIKMECVLSDFGVMSKIILIEAVKENEEKEHIIINLDEKTNAINITDSPGIKKIDRDMNKLIEEYKALHYN